MYSSAATSFVGSDFFAFLSPSSFRCRLFLLYLVLVRLFATQPPTDAQHSHHPHDARQASKRDAVWSDATVNAVASKCCRGGAWSPGGAQLGIAPVLPHDTLLFGDRGYSTALHTCNFASLRCAHSGAFRPRTLSCKWLFASPISSGSLRGTDSCHRHWVSMLYRPAWDVLVT